MAGAWHQRSFPYPLLASWTGDYRDCDFGLSVLQATLRDGSAIDVGLEFRLTSEYLCGLIDSGSAQYVVEIACPKTFVRCTRSVSVEDRLDLEAGDYAEELFLTPQIVCSAPLADFISDEHSPEWREYRPEGFSVPEAGVLAVGKVVRITIEETGVNSVIDLIGNSQVEDGVFHVELDEERIKIHVSPGDKGRIETLRQRRIKGDPGFAALFPSLYLSAVSEALRQLREHQNSRWAFAMRAALERCGLDNVSPDLIQERSLVYAQQILEHPMSGFLEAATSREEDE